MQSEVLDPSGVRGGVLLVRPSNPKSGGMSNAQEWRNIILLKQNYPHLVVVRQRGVDSVLRKQNHLIMMAGGLDFDI